ncbi:MAG: L-seryl-tRNA(Sec) selenium transferase, partial [Terrabacter sp.]|nr:L-seryl-tRNA(Sec) selenium transferase [Terrabacter sp.]
MTQTDPRRRIPRTDALLADPVLAAAVTRHGADAVKSAVRLAQERARTGEIEPDQVAQAARAGLPSHATTLRPLLNATGVVVHTNVGRAPLSAAAVEAVVAAAGYVDVEYDVGTGARAR